MNKYKRSDTVFAIIVIFTAIIIGVVLFRYPMESSYFPRIIAGFLIFMGVVFLIRLSLANFLTKRSAIPSSRDKEVDTEDEIEKTTSFKSAGLVFVLIVGYIIAIKIVNYEIATLAFFFFSMQILGYKNMLLKILISSGMTLFIFGIFFYMLAVSRPDSLFFS